MNLVGNDSHVSEESMRKMWVDSMKAVNCSAAEISYEDFLLLMKGQTRETAEGEESTQRRRSLDFASTQYRRSEEKNDIASSPSMQRTLKSSLMPLTPIASGSGSDDMMDLDDTPLSMDDGEGLENSLSLPVGPSLTLTPPSSPKKTDYNISPMSDPRMNLSPSFLDTATDLPQVPLPKPGVYVRKRSRSFDTTEFSKTLGTATRGRDSSEYGEKLFVADARRAVALPARDASTNDENKSALQVNRQLYRKHRQMRLAVTEASKRFEEQQANHARKYLLAQEAEKAKGPSKIAGLVMRRVENKTVSSEAVKKLLEQNRREQQEVMKVASLRGGRGRRTRKKTISDLSGMMGSLSQEDIVMNALNAQTRKDPVNNSLPSVIEVAPTKDNSDLVRGATVPGEFKKVQDPFSAHGKYSITPKKKKPVSMNETDIMHC